MAKLHVRGTNSLGKKQCLFSNAAVRKLLWDSLNTENWLHFSTVPQAVLTTKSYISLKRNKWTLAFTVVENLGMLPTTAPHYETKCLDYFGSEKCQANLCVSVVFLIYFSSWGRFVMKPLKQHSGDWIWNFSSVTDLPWNIWRNCMLYVCLLSLW